MLKVSKYIFLAVANEMIRTNQRDRRFKMADRTFRAFFGVGLITCVKLWEMCNFPAKTKPKHMMWALMFLKTYDTEEVLASCANTTPKTFRKWIWPLIDGIALQKKKLVRFRFQLISYEYSMHISRNDLFCLFTRFGGRIDSAGTLEKPAR